MLNTEFCIDLLEINIKMENDINNHNICVVGAGNWGRNHIRTLHQLNSLGAVVENDPQAIRFIKEEYPYCNIHTDLISSLNKDYDGFIVATPPLTHFEIAKKIIESNKPLLVEKPLTLNVEDAVKLNDLAKKNNVNLMVGHLLLFHPAFNKISDLIGSGILGEIQYIYSNRLNLGTFRSDENVFWSFAPHDISLFQFFTESFPVEVQSSGGAFIQKNIHDTTITYLKYPDGVQGHIYVSWLHPFKEHRLVIIGSKGSLHFEDSTENKPLLFYEKDSDPELNLLSLKNKPSRKIEYEQTLPLTNELKYFIDVVGGKKIDKATFDEGLDVVKILEMATNSLTNKTLPISPS